MGRALRSLLLAMLLVVVIPGPARAADPVNTKDCQRGTTRCVDAVIAEMRRRLAPLVRGDFTTV